MWYICYNVKTQCKNNVKHLQLCPAENYGQAAQQIHSTTNKTSLNTKTSIKEIKQELECMSLSEVKVG